MSDGPLRVALVGGPMYDHLYSLFEPGEIEVVVHADHPTLNREVASRLAAGERIDVLSTHSKYAPSQAVWLRPLDGLVDAPTVAALAPRAVELCRVDGRLLSLPRLIDVRVLWARRDRMDDVPDTWQGVLDAGIALGFPGRESGLFGTFFELVVGMGGRLFDDDARATMATPEAEAAVRMVCDLAANAPADLPTWHYDEVDAALLAGRVDAAGAWPGAWGAIRSSEIADVVEPHQYPAGPLRRVSYAGCHSWAIPSTCGDIDGARELVQRLAAFEANALDASGGTLCAHTGALAAVDPDGEMDRRRLEITRRTIDEAMITYPSLARFPEIEDAGWSAINAALRGEATPVQATNEIQSVAEQVLG